MLTPEGHRCRLRSRFNTFADHEVLELLLTYAIPRKDVKPIARVLLDRFGSLSNALDATPADLLEVEGVGESAATLLHLTPALARRYLRDRWGDRPRLATREEIGRFVVHELTTADYEIFLLVALTREYHLVRVLRLAVLAAGGPDLDEDEWDEVYEESPQDEREATGGKERDAK